MRLATTRTGDAVLISVAGEIDTLTVDRLRTAVQSAIAQPGPGPVVLDLSGVVFLASDGLGVLVVAARDAAARDTALRIVAGAHRQVLGPLRITALDKLLPLYPSVEAALLAGPPEPHLR